MALCADSASVFLGAKGAARWWKINGWKGSSGPVSNVPLWQELLGHLDETFQQLKWVKLPSHVNSVGNEKANTLANKGRVKNPLYPAKKTPHGRQLHRSCNPACTDKRPKITPPGGSFWYCLVWMNMTTTFTVRHMHTLALICK